MFQFESLIIFTLQSSRSRTLERGRTADLRLTQNNIQSRSSTLENGQRPPDVTEEGSTQYRSRESTLMRRDTDPRSRKDQLLSVCAALLAASSMHVSTSRLTLFFSHVLIEKVVAGKDYL